jgi:uncharacterized protein (TIGR02145 family)
MKKTTTLLLALFTVLVGSINAQTVTIGKHVWMAKNLNVEVFRNGDSIPEVKTNEEWEKAWKEGKPAWCYYDNNPTNGTKYGKLYNWFAVNDPRGLAPKGWHIPSDSEWTVLTDFLGGEDVAGKKMKSTSGWQDNGNGNNKSGFSCLSGGCRRNDGKFAYIGEDCYCWSSTESEYDKITAWYRLLNYGTDIALKTNLLKECGLSVRCLKD